MLMELTLDSINTFGGEVDVGVLPINNESRPSSIGVGRSWAGWGREESWYLFSPPALPGKVTIGAWDLHIYAPHLILRTC